jgi:uncharacterized protein with HEPN domain
MGSQNKRHPDRHRSDLGLYTKSLDFEGFRSATRTFDAAVRNFEIIGEAAAHLPIDIAADHPEIPWQDMRDMRNVLSHEYFGVNEKIVWETLQYDLRPLVPLLKDLLRKHGL